MSGIVWSSSGTSVVLDPAKTPAIPVISSTFIVMGVGDFSASSPPISRRCLRPATSTLRPGELMTRCLLDNTPLVAMTPAEIVAQVPPRSRDLAGPMRRCPTCGRAYWRGSHVRRMEAALETALGWG